jgi:uncharacterized protein (DUF58 family)
MRIPLWPGRVAMAVALAVSVAAALVGATEGGAATAWRFFVGALGIVAAWALIDLARSIASWMRAPPQWHRRLPAALALGVPHTLSCALVNEGGDDWWLDLAESADPALEIQGLPLELYVPAHSRIELHVTVVPRRRGDLHFAPAELTLRTLHGSFRWRRRSGEAEQVRVYPDFTALGRYDALQRAGRLAEAGLRALPHSPREGAGVVWIVLDAGPSLQQRFDEALDALVLAAHVALRAGDAVGAMVVGAAEADPRIVAPARGPAALNTLMAAIFDAQPQGAPSDFTGAAGALMEGQRARCRILLVTGLDAGGSSALRAALRLLRTRHEVDLVNVRATTPVATTLLDRYAASRPALNRPASASRR